MRMFWAMSLRNPIHAHAPQGPSPMPFDLEFRRSVREFLAGNILERRGISPSRLGLIASGDPGFVRQCIELGGDVQLDTADTVRVQIGEPPFREQFCRELELFMELTGMKPWAVGWCSVRNAAFVTRLFGGASPNLRTVDRVRNWMHAQLRGEQRRAVFGAAAAVASSATAPPDCPAPADCPVPAECPAPAENPRGRT